MQEAKHVGSIVLVGFMGAGKSTIARHWAQRTGAARIDLDAEIVAAAGKLIPEIFRDEGETVFRERESAALRILLGRRNIVLATGGGVVECAENWPLMRSLGTIVFLDADWKTLQQRLELGKDRPLANLRDGWESVAALWRRRLPLYRQAEIIIATDGCEPEETVQKILDQLGPERCQCTLKL